MFFYYSISLCNLLIIFIASIGVIFNKSISFILFIISIFKLVNLILTEAIKEGSTDIHIEPGRDTVDVRIRIDGVLVKIMSPPSSSQNGIIARIKILSKLNIAEHRLPQDGRMKIKTTDREIDVRVSILPTVHGEKIVLRLLGSGE